MDQAAELLHQLEDIELPERSGLWLAPGWILLILFSLFLGWVLWLLWRRYVHRQHIDWRPDARVEISLIRERVESGNYENSLPAMSQLARRIALALDDRSEIAELTGDRWLRKLDELAGSLQFTQGPGRMLKSAPYRAGNIEDDAMLLDILHSIESLVDNDTGPDRLNTSRKPNKLPRSVALK